MSNNVHLIIPAAGLGSRFAQIGINIPKPLIPIEGIPMINWVISNFPLQESDQISIISRTGSQISDLQQEWFKDFKIKLNFIEIRSLSEGPADTVSRAINGTNENLGLIVANSDQYVTEDLGEFVDSVRGDENSGSILTMEASGTKWSYVTRDQSGLIDNVVEKVEISSEATVGIYGWTKTSLFSSSLSEMILNDDRVNNEFYVAPTYNYLIKKGIPIKAINIGPVESAVHGLGTPEDLDIFQKKEFIKKEASKVKARVS